MQEEFRKINKNDVLSRALGDYIRCSIKHKAKITFREDVLEMAYSIGISEHQLEDMCYTKLKEGLKFGNPATGRVSQLDLVDR